MGPFVPVHPSEGELQPQGGHPQGARMAKRWLLQGEGLHMKHVGGACLACMQDPQRCVPELWVRREGGWAGVKGHLFLLSHTVALSLETNRVPNSNLVFQMALKICFSS